jgi:hypothetical protein
MPARRAPVRATAAPRPRRHGPQITDPFAQSALRAFLSHRHGDITAAVQDERGGRTMVYRPGHPEDTASIAKVQILATLLHERRAPARLNHAQRVAASRMIEISDNDSADALFRDEGGAKAMQAFDDAAGLTHTRVSSSWGLTRTTPTDQLILLGTVLSPSRLLTRRSRAYISVLMHHIAQADTWGVTAGPRAARARVAFKNGWLPRAGGWQVNSIGSVAGSGRRYRIAVMTDGDVTESYGIDIIQRISRAAWADLKH